MRPIHTPQRPIYKQNRVAKLTCTQQKPVFTKETCSHTRRVHIQKTLRTKECGQRRPISSHKRPIYSHKRPIDKLKRPRAR